MSVRANERYALFQSRHTAIVAHHQPLLRQSIREMITRDTQLQVVGEASTSFHTATMVRGLEPDLVVADVGLPDLDDVARLSQLGDHDPGLTLILTGPRPRPPGISAAGWYDTTQHGTQLLCVLHEVAAHLTDAAAPPPPTPLTSREQQVFDLVVHGHSNRRIGELLHISHKTVDTHRTRLMAKLKVHSTVELVRHAAQEGLLH